MWCPCITFGRITEIVDKGSSCKYATTRDSFCQLKFLSFLFFFFFFFPLKNLSFILLRRVSIFKKKN